MYKHLSIMYKHLSIFWLIVLAALPCNAAQVDTTFKDTLTLKEVVVTQRLIKHEAGKVIINVTPFRKGKTNLVDLLSELPGINVNGENINIIGKGSIKVMLNGRLKNMPASEIYGMLKARPAYNVTKVEIIKEPGAKYDAEGNYGILNIITERKIDYIGGDIGEDVSYSRKWKNQMRASLNYSKKKIDTNFNGGWTYGKTDYTETNQTYFTNLTRHSSTYSAPLKNNYNLSGMIDYHLDSLSIISLSVIYSNSYKKNIGQNKMHSYDVMGNSIDEGNSISYTHTPRENLTSSFYIDRQWNSTDKISFTADLFRYDFHNYYDFSSNILNTNGTHLNDKFVNNGRSVLKGFSATLDFDKQLPWGITMNLGGKVILTTTNNNTLYDITTLPLQNDDFEYTENVYAGYLTFNKKAGKFDFILGGRYEWTWTNSISNDTKSKKKSYGTFVPDMRLSYNFDNGSNIALSVNSSLERPEIRQINPFSYYMNRYEIATGNPELRPSTWWNIRLSNGLAFNGGQLVTEITYAKLSNIIDQTITTDPVNNISTAQWNNALKETSWNIGTSFFYYKLKWVKISAAMGCGYDKTQANIASLVSNLNSFSAFGNANLRFVFDKNQTWSGFIGGFYTGREKTVNGRIDDSYGLNCGLNHSCLNNRLNIKLTAINILASKTSGYTRSNDGMYMIFKNDYRPLTFILGLSYSFGKAINIKSKKYSSEDIESRF